MITITAPYLAEARPSMLVYHTEPLRPGENVRVLLGAGDVVGRVNSLQRFVYDNLPDDIKRWIRQLYGVSAPETYIYSVNVRTDAPRPAPKPANGKAAGRPPLDESLSKTENAL